ncbi:MAG: TIGR02147 family protein [Bacteriovoracaceae bacterium]|nr:TIGR02147 family protein [Bacteriovoracaceae bacterium]
MEQQIYYVTKLKECLCQKQRQNPHYSLRAFSRDIDLHVSTLSQILKGKRGLPFKRAKDVVHKLALTPKEKSLFIESFYKSKTNIDDIKISEIEDRYILDESYYKVIAEWEHYAILDLFDLKNFIITIDTISKKLDLTKNRTEVVLSNLINCGLIIENDCGELIRAYPDIRTTEDISSDALKQAHKENLNIGINKLEEIEVEFRDFSSTTVAIDLEKLPEAKTIIREFRQKMIELLRDGNKTDVFQLAIQFYPLTKMEKMQ